MDLPDSFLCHISYDFAKISPPASEDCPAAAFHPAPKVDSAILRVDIYSEPPIPREMLSSFFKLTKAGFSQKRKTLRNSLSSGLRIKTQEAEALSTSAGIDFMRCAETLSVGEWEKLCEGLERGEQ
jgi:16S rRNA (adenine1518-N6/adenine1519-N6)-dimethyltransferase